MTMPRKREPLTKEQAQKIRAARDSKDPLHWLLQPGRLGPTQHEYIYSTVLHRLATGGNRTGKTTIGLADTALILRGKHPVRKFPGPVRALILTQTRAQAAQVVGRKLFEASELPGPMHDLPMIPSWEYDPKDLKTLSVGLTVPYELTLKNGSYVMFAWSGVEATWTRIQGTEFDLADLDEDAGSPELIREIYGRLLVSRSDKAKPYGGAIGWHATPTTGGEGLRDFRKMCDDKDQAEYAKFHIKAGENPAVSDEALGALREAIGAKHFAVRGTGTKDATDLVAIYGDQWDDAKHIAAVDHVPTDDDCLWASIDPGFAHPAGILLTALTRDDPHQIKVIEYHDVRGRAMADWLKIVAEWLDGRALDGLVLDRASHKTEYTGKSVFNQIRDLVADQATGVKLRNPLMTGRNRHWDGISRVRAYLKPHDRAEPLIKVNPTGYGCGLFVSQMKAYRGRASTKFTGEGGVVKKDDEGPDTLRYEITTSPCWVNNGPNPKRYSESRPQSPIIVPVAVPVLSPDQEQHQKRLRISASRISDWDYRSDGVTYGDV
jgi:hypothetical protein